MEALRGEALEPGYFYSRNQLPKGFYPLLDAVGRFDEVGSCFLAEGQHGVYLITARHCFRTIIPHCERVDENGVTRFISYSGRETVQVIFPGGLELRMDLSQGLSTLAPGVRMNRDVFVTKVGTTQRTLPTVKISSTPRDLLLLGTDGFLISYPDFYLDEPHQTEGPVVSKGELILNDSTHQSAHHLHFSTRSEPGSSGGPIVNSSGEAMAVCVQGDDPLLVNTRPNGIKYLPVGSYAEPLDFLRSLPDF